MMGKTPSYFIYNTLDFLFFFALYIYIYTQYFLINCTFFAVVVNMVVVCTLFYVIVVAK